MRISAPLLALVTALAGTPALGETNPSASLQTPPSDAAAVWSKCVEERVDAMARRAPRDVAPLDIAGTVLVLCSREEFLFGQALARTMDMRAARVRIAEQRVSFQQVAAAYVVYMRVYGVPLPPTGVEEMLRQLEAPASAR
jgi:hypothetical protein